MIPKAQPLPNGLVVMFEGIDGVGKTTQVELAQKALEAAGWPVATTRNLGGTPIGEALREALLLPLERPPMTDLYTSLAIQEPLLELIDSERAKGQIVLMDRGPLSLAAYQIYGTGVDETIGWQYVEAGMNRIKPEAVIIYQADTTVAVQRGREHSGKPDYFENKPLDYFERVAHGYQIAAQRYDAETIDASASIESIHRQTITLLEQLLPQ